MLTNNVCFSQTQWIIETASLFKNNLSYFTARTIKYVYRYWTIDFAVQRELLSPQETSKVLDRQSKRTYAQSYQKSTLWNLKTIFDCDFL